MRVDAIVEDGKTPNARSGSEVEAGPAQLIAELVSAGLVSVEADLDGEPSFALTPRGMSTARLMAMSGRAHAMVLLGALTGTPDRLN